MAWSRLIMSLATELAKGRVLDLARNRVRAVMAGAINGVRRSLVLALVVTCLLQIMTLGLIGGIVTATLLWGGDHALVILLGLFAALFTLPAAGVAYLMSERTWVRAAGAAQIPERE